MRLEPLSKNPRKNEFGQVGEMRNVSRRYTE
jgi:hypothetical protein